MFEKMMSKKLLVVLIVVSVIVVVLAYVVQLRSPTETASERQWRENVDLAISSSARLAIEDYAAGKRALVDRSDPLFDKILGFLKSTTLKKATPKPLVQGTTTVSVAIPYPWGYFLTFELNDGSRLTFDLCHDGNGGGVIWFEIESTPSTKFR